MLNKMTGNDWKNILLYFTFNIFNKFLYAYIRFFNCKAFKFIE